MKKFIILFIILSTMFFVNISSAERRMIYSGMGGGSIRTPEGRYIIPDRRHRYNDYYDDNKIIINNIIIIKEDKKEKRYRNE